MGWGGCFEVWVRVVWGMGGEVVFWVGGWWGVVGGRFEVCGSSVDRRGIELFWGRGVLGCVDGVWKGLE